MKKIAIVSGALGQDGFYLSHHLLQLGYEVIGTSHRQDAENELSNLPFEFTNFEILELKSNLAIAKIVKKIRPTEIYNLASRASSSQLFDDPIETGDVNGLACTRWLEAISQHSPTSRFCQAISSEIYAGTDATPQDENTCIAPINAYGASKAYALHMVNAYRMQKNIFACAAIVYNHESIRRKENFVSRKITSAAASIYLGLTNSFSLGGINAERDWSHAKDIVEGMQLSLQHTQSGNYIFSSGTTRKISDFCDIAFKFVGLNYKNYLTLDQGFLVRDDICIFNGDYNKAKDILGWCPKISFESMIYEMVEFDIARLKGLQIEE